MGEDAFPFGANLCSPDRSWDVCPVYFDLSSVGIPDQLGNVLGVIGPGIDHGQQDSFDPELRVDLLPDLVDRS